MELQLSSSLSHTLQTASVATVIFLACVLISQINYRAKLAKLPAFRYRTSNAEEKRQTFLRSATKLYNEGYEKFKDSVYRMLTSDGRYIIVVPAKFLPELRRMPDDVLSLGKSIEDTMETRYTKLITDDMSLAHAVKADLTPALVRINPIISREVEEAMRDEMPPCDDWTPVNIYFALVNIVAKVSGRVFVGPELCQDKEYLDAGINYTMDVIEAQRTVKEMKPFLRPFLANRLPAVRRLRDREQRAMNVLGPIVEARIKAESKPGYERPDDMLQWFLNRRTEYGIASTEKIARLQLNLIFAAIHTTTMTATNIFYSLASTPECMEPLREEIRAAVADNGGIMTTRALQQMEKLDSYMKETMRCFPPGTTSFGRKVMKGITLSNGQYIPAGSTIEVPSYSIYQDESIYPNSAKFDGFRFYKMRQESGGARNQFVSLSEQHLGFGYGKHACPGRFFAANEIKMIVARTVLEYDFRNEGGRKERYQNHMIGRSSVPDASKKLLFKKITV
ncbi:cytochrome P450 monooxygenase-like protein [Delitschia confertaspora ATCC 74209]|uniref:Cytochrome P450 monooxygenase-like protein n=1 Tax=Delitschia confertaspora ATCC 74209 TaxID=1513339 RepID=A0A9P4JH60_9PLEO|nr:cytochrome P450 monooxygenase-like protein [Delitschia confertaspora ATCC 74209]